MILIIAGTRTLEVYGGLVRDLAAHYRLNPKKIIAGGCPTGADRAAPILAQLISCEYEEFKADWDRYGKAAGPKRNTQMAEVGDALLLIWDGESNGSANMKSEMKKRGKPIFEVIMRRPQ